MEKINRQFWGKLIRQSLKTSGLQYVTWGGAVLSLSIKGSLLVD